MHRMAVGLKVQVYHILTLFCREQLRAAQRPQKPERFVDSGLGPTVGST